MVVLLGEVVADSVIWHERARSRRPVLFCISGVDNFIFAFVPNVLMEAVDCRSPVGLHLVVPSASGSGAGWVGCRGVACGRLARRVRNMAICIQEHASSERNRRCDEMRYDAAACLLSRLPGCTIDGNPLAAGVVQQFGGSVGLLLCLLNYTFGEIYTAGGN